MKKIREYSIPLILGIILAMVFANVAPTTYHHIIETPIIGQHISFHWLVNDIFMVFFFASAGIEIIRSLEKDGPLHPINKAVTPLMATLGGILGPILVFFLLNSLMGENQWQNGWGIVTATDIAIAWFIARIIFGKKHGAVSFLLLLAVADDAIGLIIIAIFYPEADIPVKPIWLILVVGAILIAFILNKVGVKSIWIYIILPGLLSWIGMHWAGVHPALSLVVVMPFIPKKAEGLTGLNTKDAVWSRRISPLHRLEVVLSPVVDYGLFFFGFSNAGVKMSQISTLTWIVMLSLILGKIIGISSFTFISNKVLRFDLPEGMKSKDVLVASAIAGIGLTVSLFIAQSAFSDLSTQGAAKMGALLSILSIPIVFILKYMLKIEKKDKDKV